MLCILKRIHSTFTDIALLFFCFKLLRTGCSTQKIWKTEKQQREKKCLKMTTNLIFLLEVFFSHMRICTLYSIYIHKHMYFTFKNLLSCILFGKLLFSHVSWTYPSTLNDFFSSLQTINTSYHLPNLACIIGHVGCKFPVHIIRPIFLSKYIPKEVKPNVLFVVLSRFIIEIIMMSIGGWGLRESK